MARTDPLTIRVLQALNAEFTNPDTPPVGGITRPAEARPGDGIPALDNFEDCTLLFLNVVSRFRTESFPEQVTPQGCGSLLVVELQVGVARCSEALTPGGYLPDAETMAHEYAAQEDDADRLDRALCRAARGASEAGEIGGWVPSGMDIIGPEGGTVAVVARALFHLTTRR